MTNTLKVSETVYVKDNIEQLHYTMTLQASKNAPRRKNELRNLPIFVFFIFFIPLLAIIKLAL